jgi:hypothetical protein
LAAELLELGQPSLDRVVAERHVLGNSANALYSSAAVFTPVSK